MPNSLKSLAFVDLERELAVTRRVLERIPAEKFGWKAHRKSMSLGDLAQHVVNLLGWMTGTLNEDVLDLATVPPPARAPESTADLLARFDRGVEEVRAAFAATDDAKLAAPWSLAHGGQVLHTSTRAAVLRTWCLSHLIHHRGQLCVMLRLNDVPVPAVYFNSADEPEWTFD